MNKTSIEWADYTSNLIRYRDSEGRTVHGCIKISAGCANCYASAWSARVFPSPIPLSFKRDSDGSTSTGG